MTPPHPPWRPPPLALATAVVVLPLSCSSSDQDDEVSDAQGCRTIVLPAGEDATTSSTTNGTPVCGNGEVEDGEECDEGAMNSDNGLCLADCTSATCGDGHVQVGVEECDLGMNNGPGSGCVGCGLERTVFVTSVEWTGDLGGLAGADMKCQALATAAKLSGTFRAWLGDGVNGPAALLGLAQSQGPFVLTDGTVVANNWADLTDETLGNAISLDEKGKPKYTIVWTNATAAGESAGADHCNEWMDATDSSNGLVGNSGAAVAAWTELQVVYFCNATNSLYCIQVQ